MTLTGPRNNFALAPAPEYLFIAGGIGITPLLPMLSRAGVPWRMVYLGRTVRSMPYRDVLRGLGDVTIWTSDRGRFDLDALLASAKPGTAVYCCGPERLLAAVEELCDRHALALHVERFTPTPQEFGRNAEFEVVLAGSGRTVRVGPDESVLDAVNRAGAGVPSTCREGTCGTCEVRVLGGKADHRDSVLTPEERAAGEYLMPCVSRSQTPSLVLDL